MRATFIVLITIFFSFKCFSQLDTTSYIISKKFYSVEDGLASREVMSGVQDHDGFLWFGTRNGLNRFDGNNFKLFATHNSKMYDNRVYQLAVDDANHLFMVYWQTKLPAEKYCLVQVMDLKTQQFNSLHDVFPNLPFNERSIYFITNDGSDDLIFLTANPFCLWKYSSKKGFRITCKMSSWDRVENYKQPFLFSTGGLNVFQNNAAFLKLNDIDSVYYISNDNLIKVFAPQPGNTPLIIKKDNSVLLAKNIYENNHPLVFYQLNTLNGGIENDLTIDKKFDKILKTRCLIKSALVMPIGLVYSYQNGFFMLNNEALIKLGDSTDIKRFGSFGVSQCFKDRLGNWWVTNTLGVFQIKIDKDKFQHYFRKSQQSLETNAQARAIFTDESRITYNDSSSPGIYANIWTHFFVKNNKGTLSTGNNNILYGLINHRNKFYVSDGAGFLLQFDSIKNCLNKVAKIKPDAIWSLYGLNDSVILGGTSNGIYKFNLNSKSTSEIKDINSKAPIPSFVYRFFRGRNNQLWAVAENGLYQLNNDGDLIDFWGKDAAEPSHHLPISRIFDAYEDPDGSIWIASSGEGLFQWKRGDASNNSSVSLKNFNITSGFPSDILCRIEPDSDNNLWISTDNGLARFNKKTFAVNAYTTVNGISNNEYNRTSSFVAKSGRIFFGGLDGVDAFFPSDFAKDTAPADIPLEVISYSQFSGKENKLIDRTQILMLNDTITLNVGDKFFTMEFQLLDYQEGRHNYAYKIDGIDKDWNYINENSIRISGMPYGNFTLHIKGRNPQGNWSKNELHFAIVVLKPFYLQWWFVVLSIITVAVVVYLIVRMRIRRLKTEKIILEETVAKRTLELQTTLGQKEELLKEIHHRVKNNLQVISSLLELQSMRLTDSEAKAAIEEGQSRVQSIAILHHQLYQNEDLSKVELSTFTNELFKQIAGVFKKRDQELNVDINIPEKFFDIDTAVPLGLILNELFTNSFKYAHPVSKDGSADPLKIDIKLVTEEKNEVVLIFKDNGIGLPSDFVLEKANSLGLRIITRLSKQIKGSCSYEFDNGAKFSIRFRQK